MNLVEIVIALLIVGSLASLLSYLTSFMLLGAPSIIVVFITCAIALKLILFVIGRRD